MLDSARTRPPGRGVRFHPPSLSAPVSARAAVGSLRCGALPVRPYGAHVELFADGHEIVVPAGIGIAPPRRHVGASIEAGGCTYPVRTSDPTGVILVDPMIRGEPTVGELFRLWGQPLSRRRLASFTVAADHPVSAFVDGRRISGDPRAIPLSRHAQIVIEAGPHVDPHPSYRFPDGL